MLTVLVVTQYTMVYYNVIKVSTTPSVLPVSNFSSPLCAEDHLLTPSWPPSSDNSLNTGWRERERERERVVMCFCVVTAVLVLRCQY